MLHSIYEQYKVILENSNSSGCDNMPLGNTGLTIGEFHKGNEFAKNVVLPKVVQGINTASAMSNALEYGKGDFDGQIHNDASDAIKDLLGNNE